MNSQRLNKEIIFLILITIGAAIIRLIALFNFGTYTFDDIFSVHFASMNVEKMFYFIQHELHPPIYYLFLNFWIKIFGDNEIITRLPAFIFSLGIIPLFYYLGKQILNKWIATLATIFFVLSYFQIFNAMQVRMYSMLTFMGLASLVLFWQIIIKNKKNLWLLYILISSLTLLTHLGGVFCIATQWLWLIILIWQKQIDKTKIKKFILSQIPILSIWFIWLIPLFLPKLTKIINEGWFFIEKRNHNPAVGLYDYFFLLLKNFWARFITATIIISAPFMLLLWTDKKINQKNPGHINANWFLFAWLLPALLISMVFQINYARIFIISYLSLYLIVAYIFYLMFKNEKRLFWPLIIIWFLVSFFNLAQNLNNNFSRWDLVNNNLIQNQKPGDKIILSNFVYELQFQRYYTGQTEYVGFYPLEDSKTLEQRIVEKNWQNLINRDNIDQLTKLTNNARRVIIIYEGVESDKHSIHDWMEKNDWIVDDIYRPDAIFGPKMITYSKPR